MTYGSKKVRAIPQDGRNYENVLISAQQPTLAGAWAKVDRALELYQDLEGEVRNWITRQPQEITHTRDASNGRYIFTIRNRGEAPPTRWSVMIGEIIHDLRSSLDHLVWQLVIANGAQPTDANQFPIYSQIETGPRKGRERRSRWDRMLRDVDATHRAMIKALQPYRRRHRLVYCPIERLRDFSNEDKHRLLITAAIGLVPDPSIGPIITLGPPPAGSHYVDIRQPQPMRWPWPVLPEQTVLLSFGLEPPGAMPSLQVNYRLGATIGFGKGAAFPLNDILNLTDEVKMILHSFERLPEFSTST